MILKDGSVKVADFGIGAASRSAQNTLTREALGSVHYISPEQAKGAHVDARSDLYSLGVVMYEMLTGGRRSTGTRRSRSRSSTSTRRRCSRGS